MQRIDFAQIVVDGIAKGFASPLLLMIGALTAIPDARPNSVTESWKNVGSYVRSAADRFNQRRQGNVDG